MNVDLILRTFNESGADYILIGGMNFFIVHEPVTTFDVDFWIADSQTSHIAVHRALSSLAAEVSFSPKGDDWQLVSNLASSDWLNRHAVFCLNSPHGAIDVFRSVPGLQAGYEKLKPECPMRATKSGIRFRSLSDKWMIQCQLALPEAERKQDRLRALGYNPAKHDA